MTSTTTVNRSERRILSIVFIALLFDLLAFTCILPLFPSIIDYYSLPTHRDALFDGCESLLKSFRQSIGAPNIRRFDAVFFGGLLGSLFSALQFVSSPLMGALSDVYGRKPMILLSITGTLLSYIIWAYSNTFTLFVLSRIIGGLSKSTIGLAQNTVADVCDGERRGRGMAMIGIAFSIGFLIGPMIGAYFSKNYAFFGALDGFYATPAYFAITLTIVEFIIIGALLPETLSKDKRTTRSTDVLSNWKSYISPRALFRFSSLQHPATVKNLSLIAQYGRIYFLYMFFYSGLEFTLTFYTHIRFDYDSMHQGRMYFFTGLLMIIVQGGYVRRLTYVKQSQSIQLGLFCIIPSYVIIGIANNHIMFYGGLALYAIASAIVVPCMTTCVSSLATDSDRGALLGIFRSLGALARALGPLLASSAFWLIGPTWCYVLGGVFLIIPLYLQYNQRRSLDEAVVCAKKIS